MKFNKTEDGFCLSWAKKIKAINILGGKCKKCGCDDVMCLEFHHEDSKIKEFGLAAIRNMRWSIIKREIQKCVLLCANCHSELHYKGARNGKIKEEFLLNRNLTKCSRCGYRGENFSSLAFHHLRDKRFSITSVLIRQVLCTVQELEDELKKCIVLCINCHRKEHAKNKMFERLKKEIYYKVENYKELRAKIDKNMIREMLNKGMRQIDIARELKCSRGTISGIVKHLNNQL